jgi:hypothetical protein
MSVHHDGGNSSPREPNPAAPVPPSIVSPTTTTPTVDKKIAFGQLRQSVSSQLCDLLGSYPSPFLPTLLTRPQRALASMQYVFSPLLLVFPPSPYTHQLLPDRPLQTRIVSGRRFVRWEVVPPLLHQHSKYISGLPLEFFFNKTSHATDVKHLHAHPLNINILSWKKGTIEDILARVKDGRIRILDRPQGDISTPVFLASSQH